MGVFDSHAPEFDDVNLSTAWNRLGKSYIAHADRRAFFARNEGALQEMRARTDAVAPRLPSRNLAGVAYGIARLGYRGAHPTMRKIAAAAAPRLHEFKPQEIANLVWAFARAGVAAPELFAAVATVVGSRLSEFKPQELANTAWAFARLGERSPVFFAQIADHARGLLPRFKAQEMVNLAWAFATVRISAPALFEAVACEAASRTGDFNSQELGNLAWAYAKADFAAPRLFAALSEEAAPRLSEFKPQELANTAWAFATAGSRAPLLFEAIAEEATPRLATFKTQELANTAWAFATAGIPAPRLFAACARQAQHRLSEYRPQEIANTAWAFATAGVHAPDLFARVTLSATERAAEFNAQELTNVAWAIAKRPATLTPLEDEAFNAIADDALSRLSDFNPQGMANLAWAFASAGAAGAPRLLAAIGEALTRPGALAQGHALPAFKSQELANLAWACATVGAETGALFQHLAALLPDRIADFEAQDVANTAWAFTVTQELRPDLARALARQALHVGIEAFGREACCQLHQFSMALRFDVPEFQISLPEAFASACRAAMVEQAPASSSQLHRDVSDAVSLAGLAHVNELCVAVLGYHCDIAIGADPAAALEAAEGAEAEERSPAEEHVPARPGAGLRLDPRLAHVDSVIIEVNGPWHYTPERSARPASETKVRHLRAIGWTVVEVPWWDWEKLQGAREKTTYIHRALLDAGVDEWGLRSGRPRAVPSPPVTAGTEHPQGGTHGAAAAAAAVPVVRVSRTLQPPPGGRVSSAAMKEALSHRAPPPAAPRATRGEHGVREGKGDAHCAPCDGGAWAGEDVDQLVAALVDMVRGISPAKGQTLREHLDAVTKRAGRSPLELSEAEWRCPGIGATLAERVHRTAPRAATAYGLPRGVGAVRQHRGVGGDSGTC